MQSRLTRYQQLLQKRDYYAILDIDPSTPDDLVEELAKKNFKKLALQYHPDRCPQDKEGVIFKALTEAKDILTDSTKRRTYRRGANQPQSTAKPAYQQTYAPRARPQPGWSEHAPSAHEQRPEQKRYPSVRVRFQQPQASFFFVQPRISQQDLFQAMIMMALMDAMVRAAQQYAAEQIFLATFIGMQRNAHFCRVDNQFYGFEAPQQFHVRVR